MPNLYHFKGKPIYSVDIHPDGSRFVTGGQGNSKLKFNSIKPLVVPLLV